MSSKSLPKSFRFTSAIFVRLLIFSALIAVAIWWLSSRSTRPSVLGQQSTLLDLTTQLYQQIPPPQRQQIEKLPQSPQFIIIQEKLSWLESQLQGFPGQQIADLKKTLIQSLARNLLENLK